jgi:NNP family nitrate/nitrite transporter-like MFS transporter
MPAIYDSLMQSRGLPSHKAWRVAYIVPFIIITAVAMCMLFLCEDTPTGKWSERNLWAKETSGSATPLDGNIVDVSTGTFPSGMTTPYNAATIDIEKKGAHHNSWTKTVLPWVKWTASLDKMLLSPHLARRL